MKDIGAPDEKHHEAKNMTTVFLKADAINAASGQQSFTDAVKAWAYALAWALAFCSTNIMTAYCPVIVAQLNALPTFRKAFGFDYGGFYIISAPWQVALSVVTVLGLTIGCLIIPYPMDQWGRKKPFAASLVFCAGSVFIQFFGTSLSVILAGGLLVGISLGCFMVLSLVYAIEVVPFRLRGFVSATPGMGILVGSLIATGVSAGAVNITSKWAYRLTYAVQWAWPLFILPALYFAPESPWWLVRAGRREDAVKSLKALSRGNIDYDAIIEEIVIADRLERELEASTTYMQCFKGANRRRTFIAIGVASMVILNGNLVVSYTSYIMMLRGIDSQKAFNMSVGVSAAVVAGGFAGLVLVVHVSRRRLLVTGQAIGTLILFTIGFIDLAPNSHADQTIIWTQAGLLAMWNLFYGCTVGTVFSVIVGEVSSARLRSKTIGISYIAQYITGAITTVVAPYLFNPDQASLGFLGSFIFGGFSFLFLIWAYFMVPDTGIPVDQLDQLFERKVNARHFRKHVLSRDS